MPITRLAESCRDLPPAQRDLHREVILMGAAEGVRTADELFAWLGRVGSNRTYDEARRRLGQATSAELAEQRQRERIREQQREAKTSRLRRCSHPGCDGYPTGRMGEPIELPGRRVWCRLHAHLAGPEDHLPVQTHEVDGHMQLRPVGELAEREAEEERRLREEDERARREREAELQRALDEEQQRVNGAEETMPPGWAPP